MLIVTRENVKYRFAIIHVIAFKDFLLFITSCIDGECYYEVHLIVQKETMDEFYFLIIRVVQTRILQIIIDTSNGKVDLFWW